MKACRPDRRRQGRHGGAGSARRPRGARCLTLPVLLSVAVASLRAQSGEAAGAAAPLPAPAIAAVLARLDACFDRADLDGYLAQFDPDHAGAHAMLGHRLEQLFAGGRHLVRTSTLTTEPRIVGPRTVVRVRHEIRAAGAKARGAVDRAYVEDTLLALRAGEQGAAVPTFLVEVPTQSACVRNDLFLCPPCNFQVGGVAGWLCVPLREDRAQALEAASFYLIGSNLACDVSVQVDEGAPAAATVVQRLGDALHDLDPDAVPGIATAWLPTAHADARATHLDGARLEVALPRDFAGSGGRVLFHLVALGGLQHLLVVRGSADSLRRHAASLQALLDSYRMLQIDRDLALAVAQPLRHHTGGTLAGAVYANEAWSVELTGPSSWTPQLRCGGAAFRVAWSSTSGSRLWLTGYAVPAGMTGWCRDTADRWLRQLCENAGLQAVDAATGASAWVDTADCGGPTRSIVCTPRPPAGPGTPRQRLLRMQLHEDLLLVADGHAATAADEVALRAAMASLRRR